MTGARKFNTDEVSPDTSVRLQRSLDHWQGCAGAENTWAECFFTTDFKFIIARAVTDSILGKRD